MFIGHFALAFGAKRIEPRVSLESAFIAAQLPDILWPCLVLAGDERVTIAPGDTVVTPLRFDSYPISGRGRRARERIGWRAHVFAPRVDGGGVEREPGPAMSPEVQP